jgi:YD repeat-containing protein
VEHGGGTVLSSSDFFDGLGRVYQITQEGPNQTTRQSEAAFDSRGLVLSATAPHFSGEQAVTTSFIYDPLGRQRRIIYPERPPTIIDYSVPGQVDVTDENGHLKRKFFDAYQRLIEVDEFNNGGTYMTTYGYDAAGSLLTVTNSQGHVTRMVYDKLGRKTIMCDPNMGTPANVTQGDCEAGIAGAWRYTYSPAGDLLTQQDAIT